MYNDLKVGLFSYTYLT